MQPVFRAELINEVGNGQATPLQQTDSGIDRSAPPVLRALVVEPDDPTAESLRHTLAALGYPADTVRTAAEALSLAAPDAPSASTPVTLLFVSESLRDMDPIDCFRRLRRLRPDSRGVLMTDAADVTTVFAAISAGFRTVLAKPIDAVDVLPLLSS